MLTVLDRLVSCFLEELKQDSERLLPTERIHIGRTVRGNPVGRLQADLRDALVRLPLKHDNHEVTEQENWDDLLRRLAPFLLPEFCHLPVALDISRAKMERRDVFELSRTCDSFFKNHACLYIHASERVGPGQQAHLEAIFVNREADGTRTWGAILSTNDKRSFFFLKWAEVGHCVDVLNGHAFGPHTWRLGDIRSLASHCFIEGLLAVHHHLNSQESDRVDQRKEPGHEPGKVVARNTARALMRVAGFEGFGRFRLIDVSAKKAQSQALAHKAVREQKCLGLTHQVTVRAHGRWQPYGPQRAYRRWIMVQQHTRGPKDCIRPVSATSGRVTQTLSRSATFLSKRQHFS